MFTKLKAAWLRWLRKGRLVHLDDPGQYVRDMYAIHQQKQYMAQNPLGGEMERLAAKIGVQDHDWPDIIGD